MNVEDHPDNAKMAKAVARYRNRFHVVHGGDDGGVGSDYVTDYKMFGDLVEPNVLNAWNLEASRRYIEIYVERLAALFVVDAEAAQERVLEELEPVMCGFFEHAFLLGVMYSEAGACDED